MDAGGAKVFFSQAGRSASCSRRLKDNLRDKWDEERAYAERMKDAKKRANSSQRDSEGAIKGKKEKRVCVYD